MSTHLKDREEKILQILAKLTQESANGKPVVVEGKKDAEALRELGVCGIIFTVKTGGKSFLEATEEITKLDCREVILLLDFDRRGKEGTRRLQQSLERAKIKANLSFWLGFQALIGREIQFIESVPAFLGTLKEKAL